ncbi:MAG: hypothetical protein NVS3B5_06560 [Sphingomicrobium sp.]
MSLLLDSYRRNAEEARTEAERSSLPNVRARAVEAAARWSELADRLERVEKQSKMRLESASQAREIVEDERSANRRRVYEKKGF